ncbi:10306_t:CDS:2 [Entrophospora sp. SA101]|nr:10306_t:CDS:2 [Entrophospora sp. SA101]
MSPLPKEKTCNTRIGCKSKLPPSLPPAITNIALEYSSMLNSFTPLNLIQDTWCNNFSKITGLTDQDKDKFKLFFEIFLTTKKTLRGEKSDFKIVSGGGNVIITSKKRRTKCHYSETVKGITRPAIRWLACKGGIKRISGPIYEDIRNILKNL